MRQNLSIIKKNFSEWWLLIANLENQENLSLRRLAFSFKREAEDQEDELLLEILKFELKKKFLSLGQEKQKTKEILLDLFHEQIIADNLRALQDCSIHHAMNLIHAELVMALKKSSGFVAESSHLVLVRYNKAYMDSFENIAVAEDAASSLRFKQDCDRVHEDLFTELGGSRTKEDVEAININSYHAACRLLNNTQDKDLLRKISYHTMVGRPMLSLIEGKFKPAEIHSKLNGQIRPLCIDDFFNQCWSLMEFRIKLANQLRDEPSTDVSMLEGTDRDFKSLLLRAITYCRKENLVLWEHFRALFALLALISNDRPQKLSDCKNLIEVKSESQHVGVILQKFQEEFQRRSFLFNNFVLKSVLSEDPPFQEIEDACRGLMLLYNEFRAWSYKFLPLFRHPGEEKFQAPLSQMNLRFQILFGQYMPRWSADFLFQPFAKLNFNCFSNNILVLKEMKDFRLFSGWEEEHLENCLDFFYQQIQQTQLISKEIKHPVTDFVVESLGVIKVFRDCFSKKYQQNFFCLVSLSMLYIRIQEFPDHAKFIKVSCVTDSKRDSANVIFCAFKDPSEPSHEIITFSFEIIGQELKHPLLKAVSNYFLNFLNKSGRCSVSESAKIYSKINSVYLQSNGLFMTLFRICCEFHKEMKKKESELKKMQVQRQETVSPVIAPTVVPQDEANTPSLKVERDASPQEAVVASTEAAPPAKKKKKKKKKKQRVATASGEVPEADLEAAPQSPAIIPSSSHTTLGMTSLARDVSEVGSSKRKGSELFKAVRQGDFKLVCELIKASRCETWFLEVIKYCDEKDQCSLLHTACARGSLGKDDFEIVKLLLESAQEAYGEEKEGFEKFINPCDSLLLSPLNAAALGGHFEIVKLLLETVEKVFGVHSKVYQNFIAQVDDADFNPLNAASEKGHVEIVKLLIEAGKKAFGENTDDFKNFITRKNHDGHTPLNAATQAASREKTDGLEQVIQLLQAQSVEAKSKPPENSQEDAQAADPAELRNLPLAAKPSPAAVRKKTVSPKKTKGETSKSASEKMPKPSGRELIQVAREGQLEKVCALLQLAENVGDKAWLCEFISYEDEDKFTALNSAVCAGHPKVVLQLLSIAKAIFDKKALQKFISQFNNDHFSPLNTACNGGQIGIVKSLIEVALEAYADDQEGLKYFINHCNKDLISPLNSACRGPRVEIVKLLLGVAEKVFAHDAEGFKNYIQHLDKDSFSPFTSACKEGRLETARELIKVAEKIFSHDELKKYISHKNKDGFSALNSACKEGHVEIVHLLLETADTIFGEDRINVFINEKNKHNFTPINSAATGAASARGQQTVLRYENIIKILLKRGANPEIQNIKKQTATQIYPSMEKWPEFLEQNRGNAAVKTGQKVCVSSQSANPLKDKSLSVALKKEALNPPAVKVSTGAASKEASKARTLKPSSASILGETSKPTTLKPSSAPFLRETSNPTTVKPSSAAVPSEASNPTSVKPNSAAVPKEASKRAIAEPSNAAVLSESLKRSAVEPSSASRIISPPAHIPGKNLSPPIVKISRREPGQISNYEWRRMALRDFVVRGEIDTVKQILKGAELTYGKNSSEFQHYITDPYEDGYSLLYLAARNCCTEIIKLLLEAGREAFKENIEKFKAYINLQMRDSFTVICALAEQAHLGQNQDELIQTLLKEGADPRIASYWGDAIYFYPKIKTWFNDLNFKKRSHLQNLRNQFATCSPVPIPFELEQIPEFVRDIIQAFNDIESPTFLTGGALAALLQNKNIESINDWDLVVSGLTLANIEDFLSRQAKKFNIAEVKLIHARLHSCLIVKFAGNWCSMDLSVMDGSLSGWPLKESMLVDAKRRDIKINACYLGLLEKDEAFFFDPFNAMECIRKDEVVLERTGFEHLDENKGRVILRHIKFQVNNEGSELHPETENWINENAGSLTDSLAEHFFYKLLYSGKAYGILQNLYYRGFLKIMYPATLHEHMADTRFQERVKEFDRDEEQRAELEEMANHGEYFKVVWKIREYFYLDVLANPLENDTFSENLESHAEPTAEISAALASALPIVSEDLPKESPSSKVDEVLQLAGKVIQFLETKKNPQVSKPVLPQANSSPEVVEVLPFTSCPHETPSFDLEKIPHLVRKMIEFFNELKYETFLTGGALKTLILNKDSNSINDYDLVIRGCSLENIRAVLLKNQAEFKFSKAKLVHGSSGEDSLVDGESPSHLRLSFEELPYTIDISVIESASANNSLWADIQADAQERDFTINALYFTVSKGRGYLCDPLGALKSIKEGLRLLERTGFAHNESNVPRVISRGMKFLRNNPEFKFHPETEQWIKENAQLLKYEEETPTVMEKVANVDPALMYPVTYIEALEELGYLLINQAPDDEESLLKLFFTTFCTGFAESTYRALGGLFGRLFPQFVGQHQEIILNDELYQICCHADKMYKENSALKESPEHFRVAQILALLLSFRIPVMDKKNELEAFVKQETELCGFPISSKVKSLIIEILWMDNSSILQPVLFTNSQDDSSAVDQNTEEFNEMGTRLQRKARAGNCAKVNELLQKGKSLFGEKFCQFISLRNLSGFTVLNASVKEGHLQVVKLLLWVAKEAFQGAETDGFRNFISMPNNNGFGPMTVAAWSGQKQMVELLLSVAREAYANDEKGFQDYLNSRCTQGFSTLSSSCKGGHFDVVVLLLNQAEVAFHGANSEGFREFIQNRDNKCFTPLHTAARAGHIEIVKQLLTSAKRAYQEVETDGFRNFISQVDESGFSPLMAAASAGHANIVKLLIDEGKQAFGEDVAKFRGFINKQDNDGYTPINSAENQLSFECRHKRFYQKGRFNEVIKILLAEGADPNIKSKDERSAIVNTEEIKKWLSQQPKQGAVPSPALFSSTRKAVKPTSKVASGNNHASNISSKLK